MKALTKGYLVAMGLGIVAAAALSCALSGCSGIADGVIDDGSADYDGDEIELGTVQQGFAVAQCKASVGHYYGVDTSTWFDYECNTSGLSSTCYFPHETASNALQGPVDPNGIFPSASGWGSAWAQFRSYGANAATFLESELGGDCTNRSGQPAFAHFGIAAGPNSTQQFVTLSNGTLSTVASPGSNSQPISTFLQFGCAAGIPLHEGEAMASATWCTRLSGTLDYNKLRTWSLAGGGGEAAAQRAVQNIVQKIYALSMGIGMNNVGLQTKVNSEDVRRDIIQTGWTGDQRSWVCNYFHDTISEEPFLNCN